MTSTLCPLPEQPTVAVAEDGSDDDQSDDVLEAPVVAEEAPVAVVEHAHQVGGVNAPILKQCGEHCRNAVCARTGIGE